MKDIKYLDIVQREIDKADADFIPKITTDRGRVAFVDTKDIPWDRVQRFLEPSAHHEMWTNRGPAWHAASAAFARHMGLPADRTVLPVANGGMALEALASLHASRRGHPLRWAVSAFGFPNTTRGAFTDSLVVDCTKDGLLDVVSINPDSVDGIVVTNPFGIRDRFEQVVSWAADHDKVLLLDNAAGIGPTIPEIDYQSFSLHQTKPYGMGEGGLVLVPSAEAEAVLRLLEYTPLSDTEARFWVNNGKISDFAIALHLARLESAPNWRAAFKRQAERLCEAAVSEGFTPFFTGTPVATSLPFLASDPLPFSALKGSELTLGKYYKPLAPKTRTMEIFAHIVNVPSHPDVASLDNQSLRQVFRHVKQGQICNKS